MMLDLVIAGGTCVLPSGAAAADIGIAGGKIAMIGAPRSLDAATRTVDATGKVVIPGGIDPHIHCLSPIRFPGEAEPKYTDPPAQVSRAALFGGTTSLIDFVQCTHDRSIRTAIEQTDADWKGACYCDYGFHLTLMGKIPVGQHDELAEAMQAGHASIKIFTTDIRPGNTGRMVQYGDIWEALKTVAKAGGVAAIHAEDNDIVMFMYEKLMRENRVGFEHMAEVHNTLSEELSFNRVIRLAERVEGAALYMVHVSAATGVAALAASRARGFPMYGETLHQYLLYSAEDYKKPGGQMYHTYPSLKFPEDQKALWEATNHGAIQVIATDELCCPLRVKLQGSRIDDTTGGNSGVEPRLSLMYTPMVTRRGYSLDHFAGMVSSNAAKIMGMFPRKGALAVGSDADIVVLDTGIEKTLRAADLHETDYTPWEGHVVTAWPSVTVLRGKVMVEGGQFFGDPKDGQFLPRKVADEMRSRPAV
jgi:dihydropyrimidinase